MTNRNGKRYGTMILRPRAHILQRIGDELISSETVAVIELVKNAYDADATRLLVNFQEPLEIGQGRIELMDNGPGMSLETIRTARMEPATLFRKRQQRSEQYGRRVLGDKGIGRFAASRLANNLEVVTRRVGEDGEIRLSLTRASSTTSKSTWIRLKCGGRNQSQLRSVPVEAYKHCRGKDRRLKAVS